MQHKKALILLMILTLAFASNLLIAGAQDQGTTISVVPDVDQATAGQEFTVKIQVTNADQIYGASFELSFDPSAFEVLQPASLVVEPGSFFDGIAGFPLQNTVDAETGTISFALTLTQPAEPISGDGVLGTVTFRALKDAPTAIAAVKASLVSPEFSEVNGNKVAQSMKNVPAQISQAPAVAQSNTSAAASTTNSASVSVASVSGGSQADATAMFGNLPASASVQQTQSDANSLVTQLPLIAAGLFFVFGLVLLTFSVGMYSRMRVRFNVMAMNEIQPEQVF